MVTWIPAHDAFGAQAAGDTAVTRFRAMRALSCPAIATGTNVPSDRMSLSVTTAPGISVEAPLTTNTHGAPRVDGQDTTLPTNATWSAKPPRNAPAVLFVASNVSRSTVTCFDDTMRSQSIPAPALARSPDPGLTHVN